MSRTLLAIVLLTVTLWGNSSTKACMPMGELVVLKKSIMSLDLTKAQRQKLAEYEETLKESLLQIKSDALTKEARLSELFDDQQFLQSRFIKITTAQNKKITQVVADYFDKMYKALDKKQREKLIKRFERTEKRRAKKAAQED